MYLVADNIRDLKLHANDIFPYMVSSYKNKVNDSLYIQITNLGKTTVTKIRKLDLSNLNQKDSN